ncbi:MAG: hypothetical protein II296_00850, partial [Bacteroidaceae bacterium]|nr:hypothetical protein [Bacteroidaceae bacterium]
RDIISNIFNLRIYVFLVLKKSKIICSTSYISVKYCKGNAIFSKIDTLSLKIPFLWQKKVIFAQQKLSLCCKKAKKPFVS